MNIDMDRLPCRFMILALVACLPACSIQRFAANKMGDVLAGGGVTYAADADPELIEAALPFSLKLMESVLAETPEHRRLLAATAAGFTQFAYAFVQQQAERTALQDYDKLREAGYPAQIRTVKKKDGGEEFRVRVLSLPGLADAKAVVDKLNGIGFTEAKPTK